MSTESKVALVTGASSGIGRAVAARLAERGHRVFGTTRTPGATDAPAGVEMLPLDVGSDASVTACVAAVLDRAGRLDVLVNNAGFALFGESEGTSIDQARTQFDVNVLGVIRMTNAVLPTMRAQGGGRIVNISSLAGSLAVPMWALYCASKFALEGYSEGLRHELHEFGISVSLVEPSFVRTGLLDAGEGPAGPVPAYDRVREATRARIRAEIASGMPPDEVAAAVVRAVDDPRPRLRYRVGREATWLPRVRAIVPPSRFEATVRRKFGVDAPAPG
jgi:NAD(P)-dependent dehydrogenase (short-subunit alcohol dehydrogenase family)